MSFDLYQKFNDFVESKTPILVEQRVYSYQTQNDFRGSSLGHFSLCFVLSCWFSGASHFDLRDHDMSSLWPSQSWPIGSCSG